MDINKKNQTKERVSRFREREKKRNMQVAVAASKLVLGKDVGDDRRSLADFIQKQSEKPDVPEDYVILFLDAVDILRSKRRI